MPRLVKLTLGREFIDYKKSMIAHEDPLRGLLFYLKHGFSHTLHVLTQRRRRSNIGVRQIDGQIGDHQILGSRPGTGQGRVPGLARSRTFRQPRKHLLGSGVLGGVLHLARFTCHAISGLHATSGRVLADYSHCQLKRSLISSANEAGYEAGYG